MARIFISFHHEFNQNHAYVVSQMVKSLGHTDISVNNGNKVQNEDLKTDEQIRQEIRDTFLKDVDVTIVIVGKDTINRKHIDWEIRSTMHKFSGHRDGAIVVINAIQNDESWILEPNLILAHDGVLSSRKWPENNEVTHKRYNWLPERLRNSLVDNYDKTLSEMRHYQHAVFPIVSYLKVKENISVLDLAIKQAIKYKEFNKGKWDTYTKMRRRNNESPDRTIFTQYDAWSIY